MTAATLRSVMVGERSVHLLFGADTDDEQRLSDGLRCRLHLLDLKWRRSGIRIDHEGDHAGLGQYTMMIRMIGASCAMATSQHPAVHAGCHRATDRARA